MKVTYTIAAVLLTASVASAVAGDNAGQGVSTTSQLVIAHRGASGYLPEHTLAAYAMSHGLGADYIEPDVVLSKCGQLVCLHDVTLERVTDVEQVFPKRARDDGRWYAIDFTLAELKTLRVTGADYLYEGGSPMDGQPEHRIVTLREMLSLVRLMNRRTGRDVGVIPEPKRPSFHRAENRPIEEPLAKTLAEFGYRRRSDKCIIQCFEADSLNRFRNELKSDLQLALLVSKTEDIAEAGGLDNIAEYADALAPNKKLIEESKGGLVQEAHAKGLKVIPWTLKNEPEEIQRFFHQYKVDALFTDYTDVAIRARDKQAFR